MKVTQVAELINGVTGELIGNSAVVNEDLSNVVDAGTTIFDNTSYDHFVKSLVDHIGRVQFVNRAYTGNTLSVLRDAWEYGAVKEKLSAGLPEATENESWELEDGAVYEVNKFTKADVMAHFWDERITFEIPISIADRQVKSAFSSASQLNAFVSMLWGMVDKSMQLKFEGLASRLVNSFILSTVANEFPSVSDNDYSSSTGVKAINLLKLYNTQYNLTGNDALTAADALYSASFIKFATLQISKTCSRMTRLSKLFNIGAQPRFTPKANQKLILLADLVAASKIYLEADTFHNELVSLGSNFSEVPYWQGSGTGFALSSVSNVHGEVKYNGSNKEINLGYVLGVCFDEEACVMANLDERTTSNYNGKAEFTNYWRKCDVGLLRDENEPFVVFFMA